LEVRVSLEDAKPGQRRLSARDLVAAGRAIAEARPALAEGDGAAAEAGRHRLGAAPLANDIGHTFTARVTKVGDALGGRVAYEFEEVAVEHYPNAYTGGGSITYTTNIVVVTGGRVARIPANPAFCLTGSALNVGDVVLARRSLRSPYAWELLVNGGETSVLAVLVAKDYPFGPGGLIEYSWAEVTGGPPEDYQLTGRTGCPGNLPAYHERNFDLPVVGAGGSGSGESGSGCPQPAFVHPLSVVRMRLVSAASGSGASGSGSDAFYLFGGHPWEDLFRNTGVADGPGYDAFHRYYDQNDDTWKDGPAVILIEAE
jgi:hypothetical protein